MNYDQVIARLLQLFYELPTMSSTAVIDIWRAEMEKAQQAQEQGTQALQQAMNAQNEAEYRYALMKPISSTVTGYGVLHTSVDSRRLTEDELRRLSREERLDFGKLRDVAVGVRES